LTWREGRVVELNWSGEDAGGGGREEEEEKP
jgi:hypothetical protein